MTGRRTFLARARVALVAPFLIGAQSRVAAAPPPPRRRDATTPRDFGAVGDGRADDTAAILAAIATLAPGGRLQIEPGSTHRISRTIILDKPLRICGTTKEQCRLLFDAKGAYDRIDGVPVALVALHETTRVDGRAGDARRTLLSDLTLEMSGTPGTATRGLLLTAPCYLYQVDVVGFGGDGFAVRADTGKIRGNANGALLINCTSLRNGGHGFLFQGDNANACVLIGCRAFENGGWGFYDDSSIGNTYVAPEADSNSTGGYFASADAPNRSVYLGPYAEVGQTYRLNPRCVVLGPLGDTSRIGGAALTALPNGDAFLSRPLTLADNENVAQTLGAAPFAGALMRIGPEGLRFRARADARGIRLGSILSRNYVDLMNGDIPVMRVAEARIAGNIAPERPWFPGGFVAGESARSGVVGAGSAPPRSGSFDRGAIYLNDAPMPGGYAGWICIAGGNPGEWRRFGAIES